MGQKSKDRPQRARLTHADGALTKPLVAALTEVFLRFDADADGAWNREELDAFYVACNGHPCPQDELEEMSDNFDLDDDGALTRRGFMQMYSMQTEARPMDTWSDLKMLGYNHQLEFTQRRPVDESSAAGDETAGAASAAGGADAAAAHAPPSPGVVPQRDELLALLLRLRVCEQPPGTGVKKLREAALAAEPSWTIGEKRVKSLLAEWDARQRADQTEASVSHSSNLSVSNSSNPASRSSTPAPPTPPTDAAAEVDRATPDAERAQAPRVYRLARRAELDAVGLSPPYSSGVGAYAGVAALDGADGFIHLSTAAQARGTARLYFRAVPDLLLIAFDTALMQRAGIRQVSIRFEQIGSLPTCSLPLAFSAHPRFVSSPTLVDLS